MKLSRVLSMILVISMIMTTFISCNLGGKPTETVKPGEETDEIITSVKRQNYDGMSFTFLTIADQERFTKEIFADVEDTQEIIYASVYRRNEYVNKYLNINIEVNSVSNTTDTANQLINSSDTSCDVYNLYKHGCIELIANGFTRDWKELSAIDFLSSWWNATAFDNLTVNGKLLLMSGSILITEIDDTIAMVYNKKVYDNYKSTIGVDIFGEALAGTWTLDKFISSASSVSDDLNMDQKILIGDDLIGYAADPNSMAMNWPFACDFVHSSIVDGVYQMNVTAGQVGKITEMLEKLSGLFNSDFADETKPLDEGLNYFINGKVFIYAVILRNLEQMRRMEDDYGVIPYPKFDENQKEYITHVGGASPIMIIPMQNCEDDDRLGTILEAMCEASYRITRPAYYEQALKEKGTRDEESKKVLDLILDSRTYDLAYISANGLAWMVGSMVATGNSSFSREWRKKGERVQRSVQDTVDRIIENNAY